jgi:hypothetical protein
MLPARLVFRRTPKRGNAKKEEKEPTTKRSKLMYVDGRKRGGKEKKKAIRVP